MLCCRLTEAHVKPNNFQKMNVRLAAQTFSERNVLAFKIYREMPAFTANEKRLKKLFEGIFNNKSINLTSDPRLK
jgi:hypothetical protein